MKVSEAIKYLQDLEQDEHILIAWWEKKLFEDRRNRYDTLPTDLWDQAVDTFDGDWSATYNALGDYLDDLQSGWDEVK